MSCKKFNRLVKVLQISLAFVLLVCGCLLIAACKHEHDYHMEVTTQPTCTEVGVATYTCEVCDDSYTEELPVMSHDLAYTIVGTEHWQACKNCTYTTAKSTHNYNNVLSSESSTCTSAGEVIKACVCGDTTTETLPLANHSFTVSKYDDDNHWLQCATCTQISNVQPHKFTTDVSSSVSTCVTAGSVVTMCDCGVTHTEKLPLLNHNYVTDTDSYVDATCMEYGYHTETCTMCQDVKSISDEHLGYGDHNVKEYPKKEMTETEPGNVHYWQCQVCGRYFNGHGCETELFEEDIFTYPPKNGVVDSIADLIKIANNLANGVLSDNYYQITATVDGYDSESNVFLISDETEAIYVTFIERENVYTIEENDVITLKGKLFRFNDDVTLLECQVVSIECDDDEIHSLFITVTNNCKYADFYPNVFVEDESLEEWYSANTNNYNCIVTGCTLTLSNYVYDAILQKLIINGKSYSMQDRELKITVGNEDIYVEFVFDDDNYCSVTLRSLDTTNNQGQAIVADEYISYTYTNGGYNEYGRLYKNSHLTFTSENANITGINITYDVDWIEKENNIKALENAVNVIKNGVKFAYEQGEISNRGKVTITIPASELCTVLEYFADVGQARVTEIIILYQTYNS